MPTTHSAPEFFVLQAEEKVDHSAVAAASLRHTVHVTVVLVGPTAVGKSSLAVALGRRYAADGQAAEIVNADSMLVYRGMDIGTAKPSDIERAAIRHHVIDVLEVNEATTVAEFQQLARAAIADCEARSIIPIVVGGSALYVRAIVDDFRFPGTDPAIRARLESELSSEGAAQLYQEDLIWPIRRLQGGSCPAIPVGSFARLR